MKPPVVPYKFFDLDDDGPDFKDTSLLHFWYIHPEAEETVVQTIEDDLIEGETIPPYEIWSYEEEPITLDKLLELTQGKDPKNIILRISRDRQIDNIHFDVIHRAPVDMVEWQAKHDKQEKEYQEKLTAYHKEKLEYDKWLLQEQIKEAQNKLEELKKQ